MHSTRWWNFFALLLLLLPPSSKQQLSLNKLSFVESTVLVIISEMFCWFLMKVLFRQFLLFDDGLMLQKGRLKDYREKPLERDHNENAFLFHDLKTICCYSSRVVFFGTTNFDEMSQSHRTKNNNDFYVHCCLACLLMFLTRILNKWKKEGAAGVSRYFCIS